MAVLFVSPSSGHAASLGWLHDLGEGPALRVSSVEQAMALGQSTPVGVTVVDLASPPRISIDQLRNWVDHGASAPTIVLAPTLALLDQVARANVKFADFLLTPVAPEELRLRIALVRRRTRGDTPWVWSIGDMSIDARARRCTIAGRVISLTPTELDILLTLAEKDGDFLSTEALSERLKERRPSGFQGAVSVHISNMRNKIGSDRIATAYGRGYALSVRPDTIPAPRGPFRFG